MRAAVTGGTGFVGAALIDALLTEGWEVAALARDPKKISARPRLNVVEGDLESAGALFKIVQDADVFFHLAGVTHARRERDYITVNVEGAAYAAEACFAAGVKFIHASSLSARAPETSFYARSKFESEQAVRAACGGTGWTALRLPAIYGPRDRATLPYFKLVKAGFAPEPKTDPPARASLLYVEDAAAALAAAQTAPGGAVYDVGDDAPEGRAWSEIGAILGAALGAEPRRIRAPRAPIALYCSLLRTLERVLGRNPTMRQGQVAEFFHPDWVARDNLLTAASDWRPATPLQEGFAKTIRWYQESGLL